MTDKHESLRPASRTVPPGRWGTLLLVLLLGFGALVASGTQNDAAVPSLVANSPTVVVPNKGSEADRLHAVITEEITAQVSKLGLEPAYQAWIVTKLSASFPRLAILKTTLDRATNDVQNVQAVALTLYRDINSAIEIDKGSDPYELGEVLERKKANCIGSAQVFYITARAVGFTVVPIEIRNDPHGHLAFHVANLVLLPDGRYLRIDFPAEQPKPIGSIRRARVLSLEEEFQPQGLYQARVNNSDGDMYQRIRILRGLTGLLSFAAVDKHDFRLAIALDNENVCAFEYLGVCGQLTPQELAMGFYVAPRQAYLEKTKALLAAITLDPQTTYASEQLRLVFWEASRLLDYDLIRESARIVVQGQQEALKGLNLPSEADQIKRVESELQEWLIIEQDLDTPSPHSK